MTSALLRPELRTIPIGAIDEPALPSRTSMDDTKMDELVGSMRAIGFISVLVVVAVGERFEVVAGHRRRIAAGRAGVVTVPCLVYPSKDAALEAVQHAENRHREDLNPADEAIWFQQLFDLHPDDGTDGVAARVGESRAYVEGRLALFQGDEEVFRALEQGRITIGVAQQLNRIGEVMGRRHLLDQALRNGATVGIVKGWVEEWKRSMEPVLRHVTGDGAPPPSAIPMLDDYFTCHLCELKEHPQSMRPIQMHDYCVQAVLVPALKFFRHRDQYLARPTTIDDARELINDLVDRFPALVAGDSARAERARHNERVCPMPVKRKTKRAAAPKSPTPLEARQAELAQVRKLKAINRAIVAEGKAVGRLLERGNVILGRVLADYLERAGMIAIDGAAYARLLDSKTEMGHQLDALLEENAELKGRESALAGTQ